MGLGYHAVEAVVREHKYRPIEGCVVMIGRQLIGFTPAKYLALLEGHGVDVAGVAAADVEIDRSTVNRVAGVVPQSLIADRAMFNLLGATNVVALDCSDYEDAEIIHDLTQPLPDELRGFADFIVDGSTLDNVFDPAMVIRNLAEMLRPGGRLVMANMFSNHYEPYAMMPPLWFLDYFVVNGFADCKVYIVVVPWADELEGFDGDINTRVDVFTIDTDRLLDPERAVSAFTAPRVLSTLVVAEKGADSTSHLMPTQQHYRSDADWAVYRDRLRAMQRGARPHCVRSLGDISVFDVKAGHLFMADDFTARDPTTEIQRLQRER